MSKKIISSAAVMIYFLIEKLDGERRGVKIISYKRAEKLKIKCMDYIN